MTTVAGRDASLDEFRRDTIKHKGAILGFLAPFVILFAATYLVPVGYAVYESFQKVVRIDAYSPPTARFGGLEQYERVLQSSEFWRSILRVLELAAVQIPIMLGLALLFALLLDSPVVKGKRFFRLAY